jgi:MoaA/NifB/PqqE/SkfB family radical SAM enzyme
LNLDSNSQNSIIQIHPTRRCNLQCLHCYSDSGPNGRDEIAIDVLRNVVDDAADLDYTVLSVSGGEPMMYRPLASVLEHARSRRMRTLITTNGTLNDRRHLEPLLGHLDLLAMSLDGPPDAHDRMRARTGAFAAMEAGLDVVREYGIPFGFLFTLTQYNVHQVEWAAAFAIEQGAALLQIHPLEASGRATGMPESVPDGREGAYALLEAERLRTQVEGRLRIQVDLASRPTLIALASLGAGAARDAQDLVPFGQLISPLVVEPDGRCVPLDYGFPDSYSLGNVTQHRLRDLAQTWRVEKLAAFQQRCRDVVAALSTPQAAAVTNWYSEVAHAFGQ